MPAQCLIENVVDVVAPLLPTRHCKTNFQRDWLVLPNALNSRPPQYLRNSVSLKSGCQISPSLSVALLARRAPELRYQAGSGSWFEYGIKRMARVCPCALASSKARSTISQWNLPGSVSRTFQYQRQYEIEVLGKSGFVGACGSFATGPTSDHFKGGFGSCPLNRWNVVMPIPGFTSTLWISFGRTTTTFDCANPRPPVASSSSVPKQQFLAINRARTLHNLNLVGDRNIFEFSILSEPLGN